MKNEILERIKEWSKKTPDKEAIIAFGKTITYQELIKFSTNLASYLHEKKHNRNGFTGVFLSQCYELPICIIATWMLGAAYVPLDPIYPAYRILEILGSVDLSCILTTNKLISSLESATPVISVEKFMKDDLNTRKISMPSHKESLAYLIFTSGTTGKPKGVKILTENLMNLLKSFERKLSVTSEDRLLSITPISFDIFGLELFLPLVCGATCIFTNRSTALDAHMILNQLDMHKISLFQAVPSTYQLLIEESWPSLFSLRHLLCGGESWDQKLAKKLFEKMPNNCTLWNVYGPTETTIWSSLTKVSEYGEIFLSPSIDKTSFFIFDENLKHTEEGELYIGGAGVASGYYDESQTRDHFIETPYMRLYKTGDIVRKVSSEKFIFVGRKDQQVKIRGFRVELGDIEQKLLEHPSISRIAIIYDYVKYPNEKSLIACIEKKEKETVDFRCFIKQKLPSYMIPQFFIEFESLPLTPNLKIDRVKIRDELRIRFSYFQ